MAALPTLTIGLVPGSLRIPPRSRLFKPIQFLDLSFKFTENASESALIFELPREGAIIKVRCGIKEPDIEGTDLFHLKFDGDRFVVED